MAAEEKLLIGLEKKTEKEKICFKWSKNALKFLVLRMLSVKAFQQKASLSLQNVTSFLLFYSTFYPGEPNIF